MQPVPFKHVYYTTGCDLNGTYCNFQLMLAGPPQAEKVFIVIMPLNGEYKMPDLIKYFSTLHNQIAILM